MTVSNLTAGETRTVTVQFPTAFESAPVVMLCFGNTTAYGENLKDTTLQFVSANATQFQFRIYSNRDANIAVNWFAIAK